MSFGLNHKDLQNLSNAKFSDAVLLFENERFSNAYYLAGYAVGIGLKACIALQFKPETLPDPKFVQ